VRGIAQASGTAFLQCGHHLKGWEPRPEARSSFESWYSAAVHKPRADCLPLGAAMKEKSIADYDRSLFPLIVAVYRP